MMGLHSNSTEKNQNKTLACCRVNKHLPSHFIPVVRRGHRQWVVLSGWSIQVPPL